jgi:hypothetical protein
MIETERGAFEASCSTSPKAGMHIKTNTARLRKYRKLILELLLSNHCRDCTSCPKDQKCRLQDLAFRFKVKTGRFPNTAAESLIDDSSVCITHDHHKCILCGNCVRVDASDEAVHGSKQANYRLHYCVDLFSLRVHELRLTATKRGEKLNNFERVRAQIVVVADRAYGTIPSIEYIRARKGDFELRLRAKAFNLYDERRERVELLSYFKDLGKHESGSVDLYYKVGTELRE